MISGKGMGSLCAVTVTIHQDWSPRAANPTCKLLKHLYGRSFKPVGHQALLKKLSFCVHFPRPVTLGQSWRKDLASWPRGAG